jgi:hypothetical protein
MYRQDRDQHPGHTLTPDGQRAVLADVTRLLRLQALLQRLGGESALTQLVAHAYGIEDVAGWAAWLERLRLASEADQQAVWQEEPRVHPRRASATMRSWSHASKGSARS